MNTRIARAGVGWAVARTWLVLLAMAAYRLGRCTLAWLAMAQLLGIGGATALVLLAVLVRWTALLQIAAAVALVSRWHWPVACAVIVVAPRLLTILPGLIRTFGAGVRHPRPRWTSAAAASERAVMIASNRAPTS